MATQPDAPSQTALQLAEELDSINLHTQRHGPASLQTVAKILADHEEQCLQLDRVRQTNLRRTGSADR